MYGSEWSCIFLNLDYKVLCFDQQFVLKIIHFTEIIDKLGSRGNKRCTANHLMQHSFCSLPIHTPSTSLPPPPSKLRLYIWFPSLVKHLSLTNTFVASKQPSFKYNQFIHSKSTAKFVKLTNES